MVFDTGRRKPIGYLKLHVFFAIEPLIIGLFSGKWHIKIRLLWIFATLYVKSNMCISMKGRMYRSMKRFWSRSFENKELSLDALSCRSLSAKEPLIIGLFCVQWNDLEVDLLNAKTYQQTYKPRFVDIWNQICEYQGKRLINTCVWSFHCTQKSPIISGSFAERDVQLRASIDSDTWN